MSISYDMLIISLIDSSLDKMRGTAWLPEKLAALKDNYASQS
jgi:hypothetical protein